MDFVELLLEPGLPESLESALIVVVFLLTNGILVFGLLGLLGTRRRNHTKWEVK